MCGMKIKVRTIGGLVEYDVDQCGYPEEKDCNWYQLNSIGITITEYDNGSKIEHWHPWATTLCFTAIDDKW